METEGYQETDVRTSFISFVDHLPSDIIRKLWLIQTLDISYNALKDQLKTKISQLDQGQLLPRDQFRDLTNQINIILSKLKIIRDESLAEANSIGASIKIAKLRLQNQHKHLEHDHKIYQNEIEMRKNMVKHSQRSNKRTSTTAEKIKLRLKVNPPEVTKIKFKRSTSPSKLTKLTAAEPPKRKRGRPRRKITSKLPEAIVDTKRNALFKAKQEATKQLKQQIKQQTKSRSRAQKQSNAIVIQMEEDENSYCICNGPAYGEMIACDNEKCTKEWFHYGCVGLVRAPRGKWYCPLCIKKMK